MADGFQLLSVVSIIQILDLSSSEDVKNCCLALFKNCVFSQIGCFLSAEGGQAAFLLPFPVLIGREKQIKHILI